MVSRRRDPFASSRCCSTRRRPAPPGPGGRSRAASPECGGAAGWNNKGFEAVKQYDVLVVGKGNAALCAALAARDRGVSVAMLEAAPVDESGGNSRFAGGVMRFAYSSVEDLQRVTDLTPADIAGSDFGTNTREEFLDTLFELTNYRIDTDLAEILVTRSLEAMEWLRSKGVRFVLNYGRQSGLVNGR